jgi:hypothetical protein
MADPVDFVKHGDRVTVLRGTPTSRQGEVLSRETQKPFQISFGLIGSKLSSDCPGFAESEHFLLF